MTGTQEKTRALILSALMVLSVFAGTIALSGSAAAAANQSLDQAVEYDESTDSDAADIELAFSGSVSVDNYTVYVDGENVSSVGYEDGANGSSTFTSTSRHVINNPDGNTDLKPSQNVVVKVGFSDGGGATWRNETVSVTAENVATTGSNENISTYQGAPVAYVAGQDESFEIYEDSTFRSSRSTYTNSEVFVVDTSDRNTDSTWYLNRSPSNLNTSSIELRNLGLSASVDTRNVTTNDNVTGTVTSNAAQRTVNVALVDSTDATVHEEEVLIDGDGEAPFDLNQHAKGDYTVVVEDQETGVTAETDSVSISEVTADASFGTSVITEERGDIANITIGLSGGADTAKVSLGSPDVNFQPNLTVTDENGDGEVVLQWNTNDSDDNSTGGLTPYGDDTVTYNKTATTGTIYDPVSDQIETGEYPASVAVETAGGNFEESDLSTVIVESRSNTSISTHTAPDGTGIENASSAEAGNTIAVSGDSMETTDLVVVRLEASGLEGSVDDNNDLASGDYTVEVREDSSTVGVNEDQIRMDAGHSAVTFMKDGDNDTYYVAFPADALETGSQGDSPVVGDVYNVYFFAEGGTGLSASFELVEGQARFDTDAEQVFVQAQEGAEVSGTSTWAPGTDLTVRLKDTGGTSPFVKTNETVEVTSDGTWSGTFDMSEQADGQSFEASILGVPNGETVEGTVGTLSASVSMSDQTAQDAGTLVEVTVSTLSNGGFIAIHKESAQGEVIGHSDYLAPGDTGTVEIRLDDAVSGETTLVAMAHKDSDNDQTYDFGVSEGEDDGPYTASDGSPVTDDAVVSISTPTEEPTTEPPTEPPTTEPPTEPPTTEPPTEPPGPTPTPTTSPGFGLIVALLALAGAALLARRRN